MISFIRSHDGRLFTLDNRRLAVFRLLEMCNRVGTIKVTIVHYNNWSSEWNSKLTTTCGGATVRIRGGRYRIGRTVAETNFPSLLEAQVKECMTHNQFSVFLTNFTDKWHFQDQEELRLSACHTHVALCHPFVKKHKRCKQSLDMIHTVIPNPNTLHVISKSLQWNNNAHVCHVFLCVWYPVCDSRPPDAAHFCHCQASLVYSITVAIKYIFSIVLLVSPKNPDSNDWNDPFYLTVNDWPLPTWIHSHRRTDLLGGRCKTKRHAIATATMMMVLLCNDWLTDDNTAAEEPKVARTKPLLSVLARVLGSDS